MRRITALIAIAIITSLAAAAAASAPAHAATPERERIELDEYWTWDFCGFEVEEHIVGVLQFTSWYDESGNRLRQIVTAPQLRVTWTNIATGTSVTSSSPYAAHKTDHADGSTTIAFTGLGFVIPSAGGAYVSSGRTVIVFTPPMDIEFVSGVGPYADFCEALESAIG